MFYLNNVKKKQFELSSPRFLTHTLNWLLALSSCKQCLLYISIDSRDGVHINIFNIVLFCFLVFSVIFHILENLFIIWLIISQILLDQRPALALLPSFDRHGKFCYESEHINWVLVFRPPSLSPHPSPDQY